MPISDSKNTTHALKIAIFIANQFGAALTATYSMSIQGDSKIQGRVTVNKNINDKLKK